LKIAVVAVTKQGTALAEKTAARLSDSGAHETVFYVPGKFSLPEKYSLPGTKDISGRRQIYTKPLKEVLGDLFDEYEGIVCIMALGIVVRLIAPYVRDKISDPAVVVMDELGQNVISVLSGHWGGANALAVQIADSLGARPVITTATDVNGLPAIEMVAREYDLTIEPFDLVKKVNSAIVNRQKVTIYSEIPIDLPIETPIEIPSDIPMEMPVETGPSGNITVRDFAEYSPSCRDEHMVVLVTDRTARSFPKGILFLRPQSLCIGVGCRKGVSCEEVKGAVLTALEESGRALGSVRSLASIDIKSGEQGLLDAAGEFNLPVEFFGRQALLGIRKQREDELSFSEFVNSKIGVGGVCEPAAILGAGETSRLILPKRKYGRVTVAIAGESWQ
jgi:cobalt-precorrin 5A hydrolase